MRAFSKKYKDKTNRQEESTDKTCALVLSKQSRNPHTRAKKFMRAFSKKYKDKTNRQEESTDKTCALVLSKQSRNPHTRPSAMRMLSGRTVVVVVLTRSIALLALTHLDSMDTWFGMSSVPGVAVEKAIVFLRLVTPGDLTARLYALRRLV
jgi:hypothetical protein